MTQAIFKFTSNEETKSVIKELFQIDARSFKAKENTVEVTFQERPDERVIDLLLKYNPIEVCCEEFTPVLSMTSTESQSDAASSKTQRDCKKTHPATDKVNLRNKLKKIAEVSASFGEFAKKVSKSMGIGSEETLETAIRFAADSEMSLKDLSGRMCISYSTLMNLSNKMSNKVNVKLSELLQETSVYKNYFRKIESGAEANEGYGIDSDTEIQDSKQDEDANEYKDLDSILKRVDMNNPVIDDRINFVLEEMGIKAVFTEQEIQLEIKNAVFNAAQMQEIAWEKAVRDGQDADVIKMQLSTLINDFCERTKSEPMKVKKFIQKLQKTIIWDSEIYN